MHLREIMPPEVEVIHPEVTIQQAAAKMRRLNIGSLPVCEGERLIGMVTDRDITVRAVAEGGDPTTTTREAMTPDIAYCHRGGYRMGPLYPCRTAGPHCEHRGAEERPVDSTEGV